MKQINARVTKELHRAVKSKAAREGKTMTEVIVTLLERWLKEEGQGDQGSHPEAKV
jgi:predicted HicB family RNase H-like nuclease